MEDFNPASGEAVVASSGAISAESNPHSGGHQIFDFSVLYDTSYYKNGQFSDRFIPLISEGHQKMTVLFNKIFFQRQTSQSYVNNLNDLRFSLTGLIRYLKNEYPE